jgi:hypothetical protein
MSLENSSDIALTEKSNKRFAEALLAQTQFTFGEYRDFALLVVRSCLLLHADHSDALRHEEIRTQRSYVIGLALIGATKHCSDNFIDPTSDECERIFEEVENFISVLTYATNSYGVNFKKMDTRLLHQKCSLKLQVSDYIRLEKHLEDVDIRRAPKELESHVADYLGGKLRTTELDCFMFKLLAEEEPVQFIHEMAWKNPAYPDMGLRPKLEVAVENKEALSRATPAQAIKGFFYNCFYTFVLIGGAIFVQNNWFNNGNDWIIMIAAMASLMLFVIWLWAVIWFSTMKFRYTRNPSENPDNRLIQLVFSMSNFFHMMRSPGKISLDRIEHKMNGLEKMNAVMPETLYVFVSDLRSRGISSI